ncbi:MAG: ABC transporter permease [Ardenticatenaceae bacterium]|nr:ABC transporter permease [Ardenticatenaceae bacterium]
MRSMTGLAWRNLQEHRLRTLLSLIIISFGVAMTLAAEYMSSALLSTLTQAGEGDLQITHGFIVEQFDQTVSLVGYILLAATAFLIFNTFAMTMNQRRQQIGLLRSLGMTRWQALWLALLEALFMGSLGTLVGLLTGPLLGSGVVNLLRLVAGEVLVFGQPQTSWQTVLTAVTLGLGITLLACLLPAWQATAVPPLAALREPQPRTRQSPTSNLQSLYLPTLFILLLFALLAVRPPGNWTNSRWNLPLTLLFVLLWLGCLGWLLPTLLRGMGIGVSQWLGRRWINGRLLGENMQRAPGRVILTVLTLALGVGSISGITGFMGFAFDDLLGDSMHRLSEEHTWAVFPFDLEQGVAGLATMDQLLLPDEIIADFTAVTAGQADTAVFRFALVPELSLLGESYFTYAIEPETLQRIPSLFRFIEGNWDTAMPIMQAGCGALVVPMVAEKNGAGVGDTISITGQNGPIPCTIAGLGTGYANASIIGINMAEAVGATAPIGLTIVPRRGANLAKLQTDLEEMDGRYPNSHLTNMRDFTAIETELIDTVGLTFNGLLLLTIIAAALGVINTTMMSVSERQQEFGLLRAVGATRRQVQQVVVGEALLIGLLGGLLGLIAGTGITLIIVTTYGGHPWGVSDLALWPAAWRNGQAAFVNGLLGLVATPFISAAAARGPIKRALRGTAVQTLYNT